MPTAIHDAYDATKYIANHSDKFNIDRKKLFIGGISSGGNCAAVISNLARHDEQLSIFHQILVNGVYDYAETNHAYDEYEKEDKICSRESVQFVFKHNGVAKQDFTNPILSPYYDPDLTQLPPTTFIIGEYDGVRNHSEAYYEKVNNVGNPVEKIVLPGQTHNTVLLRKVMSDGDDPAEVIARIIKKNS